MLPWLPVQFLGMWGKGGGGGWTFLIRTHTFVRSCFVVRVFVVDLSVCRSAENIPRPSAHALKDVKQIVKRNIFLSYKKRYFVNELTCSKAKCNCFNSSDNLLVSPNSVLELICVSLQRLYLKQLKTSRGKISDIANTTYIHIKSDE